MKTIIVLVCAASLALTGCVNTYDLARAVPELPPDQVSARLPGNVWKIETLDGQSTMGRVVAAGPDSITYVDEYSDRASTIQTRNLATVSSSPGAAGPVIGLIGGGLVGFFVGGSIGASAPVSNDLGGIWFEGPTNMAVGMLAGGAIGAAVGLIVGSELSAGSNYIFNTPGNASLDTTIIIGREDFLGETATSVTFRWQGKERTVSKSVAMIYPQGELVRIVLIRGHINR